jgi:large conductance mechanosensitive channel
MFKEFRTFIARGNVVDLAVGVIMGASFGKIVNSLVNDMIMPPIGFAFGKVDFSSLYVSLNGARYGSLEEAKKAGAPIIAYGAFLNTIIEFLLIAFAVFLLVKGVNRIYTFSAAKKECPYCKEGIAIGAVRCPQCTSELETA